MSIRVSDIVGALEEAFPLQWAEGWDNCGLLVGDGSATVRGVLVTLDPTAAAIERAVALGADVIVSHHPAYLEAPRSFGPGSIAYTAAAAGVALVAAHTNLDRAPDGATSLARALGLPDGEPVERSLQPVELVSVYVPPAARDAVTSAMRRAGAGRIGLYEGCSFEVTGLGRYRPIGAGAGAAEAAEDRVEVVVPVGAGAAVARAAAAAHPYEEPVVSVVEGRIARGAARLGRVCDLEPPVTLSELARTVAARLGCTPRVWGDQDARVERVATATGSASSLLGDVLASGAHALVAGEVRYHDALSACEAGLAIVEAGHDVTEWPLVPVLAAAVSTVAAGSVPVHVEGPTRAWWTP